jgi:tetratricopeptide (TPR) repeat protein
VGKTTSISILFLAFITGLAAIFCPVARAQTPQLEYERAAASIRQGRWAEAIAPLERILKEHPANVRILNLLGVALSNTGRPEEALASFEKALAADASFHPALKNLAVNEMSMGRADAARRHFTELLKLVPDDPVAHRMLAEFAFTEGDFAQAAGHFDKSGQLIQSDARLTVMAARSYLKTGQQEKAAGLLETMPEKTDAATRFEAGFLLAELGRYPAAIAHFEDARADGFPDAYQLGFNLTLAYVKDRQFDKAVASAEALIAEEKPKAELLNLAAMAYEGAGDTEKAYNALRKAIETDPADPVHYIDLIDLCMDHQNVDLALEIADIAVQRLPESARLQLQRGVVLAMKGRFEEARDSFKTALTLGPDNGLSHVALALIHMQMDHVPEALEVLRARRANAPDDPLVHWFLGEALNRGGAPPGSAEEKEAIEALQKSIALRPDVAEPRILLGKMQLRAGDLPAAAEQLGRALELDPGNVSATYQLAQVRQKQGDREGAKALFDKVQQARTEDRDEFTQRGLLRIVREGSQ